MAVQFYPLVAPLVSFGRLLVGLFANAKTFLTFWLITHIGDLVITALYAVGAGYVSYELGSFALDTIYTQLENRASGMNEILLASLKTAGVFEATSVLFGGYAAAMSLRGVYGSVTSARMRITQPQ